MKKINKIKIAKNVIKIESKSLASIANKIGQSFQEACDIILKCKGRVVTIGLGKSGHIAAKSSATLSSTGTPSTFIHAGEALHGDIGGLKNDDIVVIYSNSGETREILQLLPIVKLLKINIISIVGDKESSLAKSSDIVIDCGVPSEACPLNLTPTSSVITAIGISDALAITLLECRGFTSKDFAKSHPGGTLGKRLLLSAKDVMVSGDEIPIIDCDELSKDVIKIISEKGIDASNIKSSGKGNRITKADIVNHLESKESTSVLSENTTSRDDRPEKRVPMSRLRSTIAKRLVSVKQETAMLTTFNEVDMTAVIDLRQEYKELFEKKHSVRLGFMSFFTKACCQGLKEIPEVNAEIDGDEIVYKNYVNMGIATGTPTGLVVPVIRNVDGMSFSEIEKQIAEKGLRARDGSLSMADMQDGTFTISNGGVYGSLMSSPILNPPQSGILGMHKIQDRPVAINGEIVIRPMMYLALSYDHRIVDGKGAVTFLVRVKEALEDPRRLLMDL